MPKRLRAVQPGEKSHRKLSITEAAEANDPVRTTTPNGCRTNRWAWVMCDEPRFFLAWVYATGGSSNLSPRGGV